MVEFIRIQFCMGRLTEEQVWELVPRFLTLEQAREIMGGKTETPPLT
ncbi:hypothetical protein [uncultured Intestinimonas sp.]|nr:hypothetical protein [uncultured Intestinimonas sp.]